MEATDPLIALRFDLMEAFMAGKLSEAVHLCNGILSRAPDDPIARRYLDRVEGAWEKGIGVPLELRIELQRANAFARLRKYAEAETSYLQIRDAVSVAGVRRWPAFEDALIQFETLRAAEQVASEAERAFQNDEWEHAKALYGQALGLAPGLSDVKSRIEEIHHLIELDRSVRSIVAAPTETRDGQAADIVKILQELRGHRLDSPESRRIRSVTEAAESLLLECYGALVKEVRECFRLTDDYADLRVTAGLLHRAASLLDRLDGIPGDPEELAALREESHRRDVNLGLAQELELRARHWFGWPQNPTPQELFDNDQLVDQLPGLLEGIRQIQANWRQIEALLPELGFCLRALACETNIALTAFGQEEVHVPSTSGTEGWLTAWYRERGLIVSAARRLSNLLSQNAPSTIDAPWDGFENVREELADQIAPLRQLVDAIMVKWSRLAGATFAASGDSQ